MVLRGYKQYEDFKALIGHLTGGEIQERPVSANEESIMAFITRYGSVAPIEIQMTFDLTNDKLKVVINSLLNKQLIQKREAGNGYLISPKVSAMACDSATGICAVQIRTDDWNRMIDVNIKGLLYGIAAALPFNSKRIRDH